MNNFDQAAKNIGNRFNLVLVASERMREIHQTRREQQYAGELDHTQRKQLPIPSEQAITEIEGKKVGVEYLNKIKPRKNARRHKLDEI